LSFHFYAVTIDAIFKTAKLTEVERRSNHLTYLMIRTGFLIDHKLIDAMKKYRHLISCQAVFLQKLLISTRTFFDKMYMFDSIAMIVFIRLLNGKCITYQIAGFVRNIRK